MNRLALPLVLLLASSGLAWLFLREPSSRGAEAAVSAPGETAGNPLSPARTAEEERVSAVQPKGLESAPMAVFMSSYWGDRWSEIEQLAREEGIDIDREVEAPPAWDKVRARFIERMRSHENYLRSVDALYAWPTPTTNGYLAEQGLFGGLEISELDPTALAGVDRIVETFEIEIQTEIRRYATLLNASMETVIATGNFMKAPFFLPEIELSGDQLRTGTISMDGWCVSYELRRGDFPALAEQYDVLKKLRRDRAIEVRSFIKSEG